MTELFFMSHLIQEVSAANEDGIPELVCERVPGIPKPISGQPLRIACKICIIRSAKVRGLGRRPYRNGGSSDHRCEVNQHIDGCPDRLPMRFPCRVRQRALIANSSDSFSSAVADGTVSIPASDSTSSP